MEFTEGLVKYVTTQQCVVHAPTGRPLAAILHQPFSPDLAPTVAVPATKQVTTPSPGGTPFSCLFLSLPSFFCSARAQIWLAGWLAGWLSVLRMRNGPLPSFL